MELRLYIIILVEKIQELINGIFIMNMAADAIVLKIVMREVSQNMEAHLGMQKPNIFLVGIFLKILRLIH